MSFWEGRDSLHCHFALPHHSHQIRKPRSTGCEIKACSDSQSGIMMRLEFLEGKLHQSLKEYVQNYGLSAAMVLRLTQPWFGTNRTVVGDSAFSSMRTVEAALEHGLHFIGIIKTGYKRFPKQYLLNWTRNNDLERGDHKVLKSSVRIKNADIP